MVVFYVKLFTLWIHERDSERTLIEHANGFSIPDTRNINIGLERDVLPRKCEQVFYIDVLGKVGSWYVFRYDPRGRPRKYNLV